MSKRMCTGCKWWVCIQSPYCTDFKYWYCQKYRTRNYIKRMLMCGGKENKYG